ncbi:MAG: GNAT family N-acetyltransferase [Carbonactinosporaceae bacterium]
MERSDLSHYPHYPSHWEADVVLGDGGTAHLRPIHPGDAQRLVDFYAEVSEESKYLRFFSPYPRLSQRDVERFTRVDHQGRVALIALIGEEMIGVVRYDRVAAEQTQAQTQAQGSPVAEVAFLVQDRHQGRGLGSVLLEHIAAAARERDIGAFVADVLPGNRRMIQVFRDAGYRATHSFADGVVHFAFDLAPTETSLAVMQAREHRAEARSIQRLLGPASVAVIGASRSPGTVGQTLLRNLAKGGFTGRTYAVNPAADQIAGMPAYRSVVEIPGVVELAVIAVPVEAVLDVVRDCASKGVHGLVVVSAGFSESGPEGRAQQREIVRVARANGMRVVGPNCLGVINTDPALSLNASLSPTMPSPGRVGLFSQSGALGVAILATTVERGLGLSTFVSAGNRADVSGNDLLQFWEEDPRTDVVLLYLESIGNPRKFTRLARRIARSKPIVAVKSGRSTQGVPIGHAARPLTVPDAAVEAMFHQAGVIRVPTLAEVFDVAQLLAYQPLPEGDRVAIVGNSDSLGLLAKDACASSGLRAREPTDLGPTAGAGEFRRALSEVVDDPAVDAVITVFAPPLTVPSEPGAEVAAALAAVAATTRKPVLTTFLAYEGLPEPLQRLDEGGAPARGSLPSYPAPENAVRALAEVVRYAEWRCRPAGRLPELNGIDEVGARRVVDAALARDQGELSARQAAELLAAYGVHVWPVIPVASETEAAAAGGRLGYPVALKTMAPQLRDRADLGGVDLDIRGEPELRASFAAMSARLGDPGPAHLVVQAMADPGVATVLQTREDPSFGSVVSFGLAGPASELLEDRAYRILPLTDVEAGELVRAVRAAPMLFGYRGTEPVDVPALERLLLRVSRLADDLPELAELELDPVVVGSAGVAVLGARARAAPPPARDLGPRALRAPG